MVKNRDFLRLHRIRKNCRAGLKQFFSLFVEEFVLVLLNKKNLMKFKKSRSFQVPIWGSATAVLELPSPKKIQRSTLLGNGSISKKNEMSSLNI